MSELTREQVNEEIRTIVGSFDIERFDEVKRCREAIMAHDAAQRAQREQDRQRIQELEAKYAHELAEVNRQKELDLASECDRLKQRLTALEQEVANHKKAEELLAGASINRADEIVTLTHALAQARGAFRSIEREMEHEDGTRCEGIYIKAADAADAIDALALDRPAAGGGEELEQMRARKDAAYLERNRVVAALARCYPSGIARTAIEGWDAEWHGCVYIDLPTGQVSWHYHDDQAFLFEGLPAYSQPWDGHDTDEKYHRLEMLKFHKPPLVWTTEKPTVPGWYWWRMFEGDSKPRVTGLYQGTDGKLHSLMKGGQWAGPLPLPKEA